MINTKDKKLMIREAERLLSDEMLSYVLTVLETTSLKNMLTIDDEDQHGDLKRLRYAEQIKAVREIRRLLKATAESGDAKEERPEMAPV